MTYRPPLGLRQGLFSQQFKSRISRSQCKPTRSRPHSRIDTMLPSYGLLTTNTKPRISKSVELCSSQSTNSHKQGISAYPQPKFLLLLFSSTHSSYRCSVVSCDISPPPNFPKEFLRRVFFPPNLIIKTICSFFP